MIFVLLGLLGLTAATVMITDDSDETPQDDCTDDLTVEDGVLTANDCDNMLSDDDLADTEGLGDATGPFTLNLEGGNDMVEHRDALGYEATINGGEGNDTITTFSTYEEQINGGAGDDVLTSQLGSQVYGEDGDDQITYDSGNGLGDYRVGTADGGAGDDSINVMHELGWNNSFDTSSVDVTGGEGADDFLVELLNGVATEEDDFGGTLQSDEADEAQVYIQDFNPDEDTLTIDITDFTDEGGFTLTDTNLEQVDDPNGEDGTSLYELQLTLLADGQTEPFEATVLIRSTANDLTLGDLAVLSGAAA